MAMMSAGINIEESSQVSVARRAAERLADRVGFGESRASQVGLVVTELATNILKHAGRGEILLTECRAGQQRGVEILSIDSGPGFSVEAAMHDGQSTAGSLGNGLGAIQRMSHDFHIFSQRPKGSVALSRMWSQPGRRPDERPIMFGAVNLPKPGEETCGDGWASEVGRHYAAVMIADGLGHGLLAAEAAAAAVEVFARDPLRTPSLTLEEMHRVLRPTRGAAVAVAAIEFERDVAVFAGLGNIVASIVVDNTRRNLVSHNGTAGHAASRMHDYSYPMVPHSTLVLHSDGLGTNWNPADYPGLWSSDPSVVAGVLYRDFTRRRDDVTVVVGKRGTT
jgi:anti-sigma regulatory factor (Ser/Thr protein kinase)